MEMCRHTFKVQKYALSSVMQFQCNHKLHPEVDPCTTTAILYNHYACLSTFKEKHLRAKLLLSCSFASRSHKRARVFAAVLVFILTSAVGCAQQSCESRWIIWQTRSVLPVFLPSSRCSHFWVCLAAAFWLMRVEQPDKKNTIPSGFTDV